MSDKAKRAVITIAGIEVEVFQIPNGGYVMSQTQVAEIVGKDRKSMSRFLGEKRLEPLSGERYTCDIIPIEKDSDSLRGRARITPVIIDIGFEYWASQAFKGNVKAQALVIACGQETLQRRCDLQGNNFCD
ncbi:hypothetical protein H6G91_26195 [Nostoc muscorum FACHB-395]|jgi:hypothetical protein|nr:hypothetical protein [Desmonostoc muscorum FACHB-395]